MSGFKLRPQRKLVADINVVPYIDVMLVLLVVFMITAPMMTQGIQVQLPETNSQPILTRDKEPVIITVKENGSYFINTGEQQQKSASLDTVRGHVLRIMKHQPDTLFLVEGDARVTYNKVVALMSALQAAGVAKLGLVTDPPEQGR